MLGNKYFEISVEGAAVVPITEIDFFFPLSLANLPGIHSVNRNHKGVTSHDLSRRWTVGLNLLTLLPFPLCHYQSLG